MHYVIGDVHGCYDELMALLCKIEAKDEDAQIIFVGDFVDRGPKVMDVLTWVMEHITPDGKYQTVRGNHEQLVIEWFAQFLLWWDEIKATGENLPMPETHYDFWRQMANTNRLSPAKILPFIRFFENMPFSKKLEIQTAYGETITYRIVHAWYDRKEPEDSEKQRFCNIWERNFYGKSNMDEIIIHGHTPTIVRDYYARGMYIFGDAPGMVCYRPGAVNIDGGCCFSPFYSEYPCMLCAVCLETLEEFYPYTLEERFARKALSDGFSLDISMDEESIQRYAKEHTDEYQKKYRKKAPLPRLKLLKQMGK